MEALERLNPEDALVESFALDIAGAGFDESKFNSDPRVFAIKADLDALNKRKHNNWQDALIAEVALLNGYGLVTADGDLARVSAIHGLLVVRIDA